MQAMMVEEDGDEVFTPMDHCYSCRLGFDTEGKPVHPRLVERDGFMRCLVCGGSYGPAVNGDGHGNS